MKTIFAFFISCLSLNAANAMPIVTNTTEITSTAQSYSSSTAIADHSYSNISLDITAKGDYGTFGIEYFQFFIDGALLADWTHSTAGISVTENYADYDYTLIGSISISDALWNTFSSDNVLDISWGNSINVNAYPIEGGADYVTYTLNGDPASVSVPEPSTLGLLGLGLVGIGFTRKKRQHL